jgi:integrase
MNYIILDSEFKLVIQEFKTQKKYKTIEHILPERLKKELEESLKAEPRSWLFIKRRESLSSPEQEMSPGEYSNWANRILTRVFGKRTTLTALRHSFASSLDFNSSLKELAGVAKSMGHSVGMSRGYVWRS